MSAKRNQSTTTTGRQATGRQAGRQQADGLLPPFLTNKGPALVDFIFLGYYPVSGIFRLDVSTQVSVKLHFTSTLLYTWSQNHCGFTTTWATPIRETSSMTTLHVYMNFIIQYQGNLLVPIKQRDGPFSPVQEMAVSPRTSTNPLWIKSI